MLEKYHQLIIGLLLGLLLGISIPSSKSYISKSEFEAFKSGCGFIAKQVLK